MLYVRIAKHINDNITTAQWQNPTIDINYDIDTQQWNIKNEYDINFIKCDYMIMIAVYFVYDLCVHVVCACVPFVVAVDLVLIF